MQPSKAVGLHDRTDHPMPCLNEAETLATCIIKAVEYLETVRRGPRDRDRRQRIDRWQPGHRGKPGRPRRARSAPWLWRRAYRRDRGRALGRFVIMGDSDDSYDFSRLDGFVDSLRRGADLVMGNRFRGGIAKGAMPPLQPLSGQPGAVGHRSGAVSRAVGDFHCGPARLLPAAILRLGLSSPGMEFASEMVIKASLAGLRIEEVPTTLRTMAGRAPPHLRSFSRWLAASEAAFDLCALQPVRPSGCPAVRAGRPIGCGLMFGPLTLGGVTFDIGALVLAATAAITGAQMMWFHVLARTFAVRFGLLPTSPGSSGLQASLSVDKACQAGAVLFVFALSLPASALPTGRPMALARWIRR